jgi:amino acid exporter
MAVSRRAGVAQALGISTGSFLWATITATGLTALVSVYASVLTFIKIVGGLYLLWLAFKAFRSASSAARKAEPSHALAGSLPKFFVRGLAIQMTNPKAALSWIAIMSLGLAHDAPASTALVIVVGTTILSMIGHVLYAMAFSTRRVVAAYGRARRYIDAALGVFFSIAGGFLFRVIPGIRGRSRIPGSSWTSFPTSSATGTLARARTDRPGGSDRSEPPAYSR